MAQSDTTFSSFQCALSLDEMQALSAAVAFCSVLSIYSLEAIMRLGVSLAALQQHPWNWVEHSPFPCDRTRSTHILQGDFTFINCLPIGLQLDSAIGLALYLLLTLLISRKVWISTFSQVLTPLLMQLIPSHTWEWRRQDKSQWCMDTGRCHFFPISNWQGSAILQGLFLPGPPIIITVAGNKK